MTERSIAELIGWERADDNDVSPTWWDAAGYLHDRWTSEDLLAWLLAGRAEVVETRSYENPDGSLGHVVVLSDDGREPEWHAPTLLAALEAAVRAVAGQEGP